MRYDEQGALPASCDACHAIYLARLAAGQAAHAERVAIDWISRTSPPAKKEPRP
jgi:hypothetical protein